MRLRSDPADLLRAKHVLLCVLAVCATAACGDSGDTRALAREPRTPTARPVAPAAATLVVAVGDVRAREAAAAAWAVAHAGLSLRPLDAVQTMAAASAGIRFTDDGTVVTLGPGTTLEIPVQRPAEVRMRHVSGHMVARLPADAEPGRRVELDLPPGMLVLESGDAEHGAGEAGIEARVDVSPESTEIAMLRGRGQLATRSGRRVTIERSRFVRFDRDGAMVDGALLAAVTLAEPHPDETVHTRELVAFSWREVTGATSYRLQAAAADGAVVETTVAAPVLQASLALPSGTYVWRVEALADGGATEEPGHRTVTVDVDREPPALMISSPAPGASTRDPEIVVRGRTEPTARVEVEGRAVPVRGDGSFETRVAVPRGLANLVVRVTDTLGNTRASSRTVLRE